MNAIEQKLDMLAEFYSQKDALELSKRDLLNDVKIPDEVLQVMNDGNKREQDYESNQRRAITKVNEDCDAKLKEIVIPDEIKAALAEIDHQRALVEAYRNAKTAELREAVSSKRNEIHTEVEAQTKDVYAQVAQRKNEIEIEFSGKADDVDANIKKLEAEIKEDVKRRAAEKLASNPNSKDLSVKGSFFHAVYVKAKKSWIPAKLDDYVETHPEIKNCYTEGEPSITLRKI